MVNKLNKDAKKMLDLSLRSLDQIMAVAAQKEDLETMVAVSDRLMLLYQHLADNHSKIRPGFSLLDHHDDHGEESE